MSSYGTSNFAPFQSGCSKCYPSTDYYNMERINHNGGNSLIPTSTGQDLYKSTNYDVSMNELTKNNMGVSFATAFGGKKKSLKKTTTKKKSVKKTTTKKKSVKKTSKKKSVKKTSKKTTKKRSLKGGSDNDFSDNDIGVDMLYHIDNNQHQTVKSGGNADSFTDNDIGVDMLYPIDDIVKKGGKKKKTSAKKKTVSKKKTSSKKKTGSKKKTTIKKKKTVSKKKSSMKGGNATSMEQRFYDENMAQNNYPANSGNGIMSAYGAIEANDIGVGMLAPFTASTSSTANHNTMMKTGGRKNNKKHNGGGIPNISDSPVSSVQNTMNNAINGFNGYMKKLDDDYIKSTVALKNMRIGGQRLLKGGKKSTKKTLTKKSVKKVLKKSTKKTLKKKPVKKVLKKSTKKTLKKKPVKKVTKKSTKKTLTKKPVKKVTKKSTKKTLKNKLMKMFKGGDGSDWASSLGSRGPASTPDDMWGVSGETWFRQFNKTGEYIPNSQLPYAATPELAGTNNSGIVTGYDERILNNGVSNGV